MDNGLNLNTNWRKVASTIYQKPTDSKIYGSVDIDVTELEKYIVQKRKEGIKITLTHVMTFIVGRAIAQEVPELNCFVRRGKGGSAAAAGCHGKCFTAGRTNGVGESGKCRPSYRFRTGGYHAAEDNPLQAG